MQTSKLNERLQLFASLSVLVGLLLVAYEVRQNNVIAEAEAISAMQSGWELLSISEYETDISELRVKSLNEPENLTEPEIYKLTSWLVAVTTQLDRQIEFAERGLTYGGGADLEYEIEAAFGFYVNNRFGRAWYVGNRNWIDPKITEIWDDKLLDDPSFGDGNYARHLKELLLQESTDH
jgi:hypothetical protein